MPISYKKLWKVLIDKDMNKTQLKEAAGVSTNVIAKLVKIAEALKVDFGDIVNIENGESEK